VKRHPRLVCIPSADREFATSAVALLDTLAESEHGEEVVRGSLETLLRRRYPTAVVRERDPLAEIGLEKAPVWYVTRLPYRSRLVASVAIEAPVELVFGVYTQPERIPDWQTAVHVTPLVSRPELVGNEYLARYKVVGKLVQGRFRIVDAEAPSYLRVEAQGLGIRLWYATTFTPTGPHTRIDVDGDYDVPSNALAHLADRLFIEKAVQRDVDYAHANLKALCEALARSAQASDLPEAMPATG
jgi:hypothetical protein